LRERERCNLAEIALDAGYCDQAHFSGEFRALCGVAPAALRREAREIGRRPGDQDDALG
jgi:AraC-like DNA-binding protein